MKTDSEKTVKQLTEETMKKFGDAHVKIEISSENTLMDIKGKGIAVLSLVAGMFHAHDELLELFEVAIEAVKERKAIERK